MYELHWSTMTFWEVIFFGGCAVIIFVMCFGMIALVLGAAMGMGAFSPPYKPGPAGVRHEPSEEPIDDPEPLYLEESVEEAPMVYDEPVDTWPTEPEPRSRSHRYHYLENGS